MFSGKCGPPGSHERAKNVETTLTNGPSFIHESRNQYSGDWTKDRSQGTVRAASIILKMMLSSAVRRGHAAFNPAAEIELPSTRRHEKAVACPTLAEIRLLLEKADSDFLRPFFHRAIFTGLSASEMRGLTWGNVDLKGRRA